MLLVRCQEEESAPSPSATKVLGEPKQSLRTVVAGANGSSAFGSCWGTRAHSTLDDTDDDGGALGDGVCQLWFRGCGKQLPLRLGNNAGPAPQAWISDTAGQAGPGQASRQ
jgi:hypothetical protein